MHLKVLILGHAGFSGKYCIDFLKKKSNVAIYGVDVIKSGLCEEYQFDATDFDKLNSVIKTISPDYIINLAGLNYADNPIDLYKLNIFPVLNILKCLQNNKLYKTKLLLISSASVYGNCENIPIKETETPKPVNLYGTSKLAMEQVILPYLNLFSIVIARPFNILGPGLPEKLAIPSFIKQLHKISENKSDNKIITGNLDPRRDFIDIRDIVNAYWIILTKGQSGEIYNVGSGASVSMKTIMNILMKVFQVSPDIITDQSLVRPNEIMDSVADISKIKDLGWNPLITLNESLADMVKFYNYSD